MKEKAKTKEAQPPILLFVVLVALVLTFGAASTLVFRTISHFGPTKIELNGISCSNTVDHFVVEFSPRDSAPENRVGTRITLDEWWDVANRIIQAQGRGQAEAREAKKGSGYDLARSEPERGPLGLMSPEGKIATASSFVIYDSPRYPRQVALDFYDHKSGIKWRDVYTLSLNQKLKYDCSYSYDARKDSWEIINGSLFNAINPRLTEAIDDGNGLRAFTIEDMRAAAEFGWRCKADNVKLYSATNAIPGGMGFSEDTWEVWAYTQRRVYGGELNVTIPPHHRFDAPDEKIYDWADWKKCD